MPQGYPAILKDRADPDGELFLAIVTPPEIPLVAPALGVFHLVDVADASAMWTVSLVTPALLLHELHRSQFILTG